MQEEMLKTSLKQRIIILAIAAILLGSSIAVYVGIIVGGSDPSVSAKARLDAVIAEYSNKQLEIADELSGTYFDKMLSYKSEVKGFNADAANQAGLQHRDIVVGDGAEISESNANYYAYYIGWCADEAIFDSSFDNADEPTALAAPLDISALNLIEGWNKGMLGAKIGGVRELTIPGELAYGDALEVCGGFNSPLKFLVMTVNPSEEILAKYKELSEIYDRYNEAYAEYYYMMQQQQTSAENETAEEASGESSESNTSETTGDTNTEAQE